ncbi:MAG: alpha/beta hydrolase [Aquincola tertiaricarbonis]|uniref:alpha/beta hydrolase n=1 Tax=Aquincola tertiaricarbonis TaxID=391953 RepID=UPI0009FB2AE1|nr:alpha/beta hydrolase [Aquincola tertiaricarbonis]
MKRWGRPVALAGAMAWGALLHGAVAAAPALTPCRLDGIEHEARCGTLERPLDPAAPQGARITLHYAVLPALARNKQPDPVFFLAGGPGQSAIEMAGPVAGMLSRFLNRRDVVLIDQRGTGRSAPLLCDDDADQAPLARQFEPDAQRRRLAECRRLLQALPHGDLRQYTTAIAAGDVEAVRRALGVARINLVGVSYGTRLALEVLRQSPRRVRRVVLDGVAPPDMVLPVAFASDQQRAVEAVFSGCEQDADCNRRHPDLRKRWATLRNSLPRDWPVAHPATGVVERQRVTPEVLDAVLRGPLYLPALAAALPQAMDQATRGRLEPLAGLAHAAGGRRGVGVAMGLHFSVVCAEDAPRLPPAAPREDPLVRRYRDACADWPRGSVPPAFYQVGPSAAPVLLLSGGLDPATPPRHGDRMAAALGAKARHVVVPQAGHGVAMLPCMRDVLYRFIDTPDEAAALAAVRADAGCAVQLPRPRPYQPPAPPAEPRR